MTDFTNVESRTPVAWTTEECGEGNQPLFSDGFGTPNQDDQSIADILRKAGPVDRLIIYGRPLPGVIRTEVQS